ncbi:MAG: hypothetical protein M3541_17475 [Acidobacteriota bacterium]|nr:hypothetical protein [Acidobacteriota bacterium]MDQ3420535.1 hypothetical protein [Acidobacteriota bacterium]
MSPSRAALLKMLALCGVIVLSSARTANAEWHFTPMAGFTAFGNTSLFDAEGGTGKRHGHVGGSVALLGSGIFGAEVLSIWTPGFFEQDDVDRIESSRAVSAMANVVITTPRRWTEYGLRPFVSGGFGLMHARTSATEDVLLIDVNTPGFNIGGGAVGFLSERTGLRFDIRYHSTLNRLDDEDVPSIGPVHLRYVTASVGIVLRR